VAQVFAAAAAGMATPDGFHGYPPDGGQAFLVDAIIKNEYESRGIRLNRDEVFVSDGAKSDTSALQELFSPDAVIAVTDPVYPVYVDANAMAGRLGEYRDGAWERLVTLPLTHENGFVPEMPKARADVLYLCSPNNPTGTALSRDTLEKAVRWARENGALIVFDAAYKSYITDPELPRSIYEIEGARECAIECCSFSKTAGFTGVRCAFTVIPKEVAGELQGGGRASLNAMWRRRQGSRFNGVSYPVQRAAEATYLPQAQAEIRESIAYYQGNARIILGALAGTDARAVGGVHAPYVWLKAPGGDGWAFFDRLLNEAGVVGTPGEGFGPAGKGCFRLTAFAARENTEEAAGRVRAMLKKG
jgi:LL-diaminopimelate aminotransferase